MSTRSKYDTKKHKKSHKSDKKRKKKTRFRSSSSDSDGSIHELSHYVDDRIRMMKELIKIVPESKMRAMAPDFLKTVEISKLHSLLLDQLLGISNKRILKIFKGEQDDTSSSETDEDVLSFNDNMVSIDENKKPTKENKETINKKKNSVNEYKSSGANKLIDVISLDDISGDDNLDVCIIDDEKQTRKRKIKNEHKTNKKENEEEKLMSVLELLELQARARAIKSQLALEARKRKEEELKKVSIDADFGSDSDAVIIETTNCEEIIISDSEDDTSQAKCTILESSEINNPLVVLPDNENVSDSKGKRPLSKKPLIIKSSKKKKYDEPIEKSKVVECDSTNTSDPLQNVITIEDENNDECDGDKRNVLLSDSREKDNNSKILITFANKVMSKLRKKQKEKKLKRIETRNTDLQSNVEISKEYDEDKESLLQNKLKSSNKEREKNSRTDECLSIQERSIVVNENECNLVLFAKENETNQNFLKEFDYSDEEAIILDTHEILG